MMYTWVLVNPGSWRDATPPSTRVCETYGNTLSLLRRTSCILFYIKDMEILLNFLHTLLLSVSSYHEMLVQRGDELAAGIRKASVGPRTSEVVRVGGFCRTRHHGLSWIWGNIFEHTSFILVPAKLP